MKDFTMEMKEAQTEYQATRDLMRDLALEIELSATYLEPDSPAGREIAAVANSFDRDEVRREMEIIAESAPNLTAEDRAWLRETREHVTRVIEAFRAARSTEKS